MWIISSLLVAITIVCVTGKSLATKSTTLEATPLKSQPEQPVQTNSTSESPRLVTINVSIPPTATSQLQLLTSEVTSNASQSAEKELLTVSPVALEGNSTSIPPSTSLPISLTESSTQTESGSLSSLTPAAQSPLPSPSSAPSLKTATKLSNISLVKHAESQTISLAPTTSQSPPIVSRTVAVILSNLSQLSGEKDSSFLPIPPASSNVLSLSTSPAAQSSVKSSTSQPHIYLAPAKTLSETPPSSSPTLQISLKKSDIEGSTSKSQSQTSLTLAKTLSETLASPTSQFSSKESLPTTPTTVASLSVTASSLSQTTHSSLNISEIPETSLTKSSLPAKSDITLASEPTSVTLPPTSTALPHKILVQQVISLPKLTSSSNISGTATTTLSTTPSEKSNLNATLPPSTQTAATLTSKKPVQILPLSSPLTIEETSSSSVLPLLSKSPTSPEISLSTTLSPSSTLLLTSSSTLTPATITSVSVTNAQLLIPALTTESISTLTSSVLSKNTSLKSIVITQSPSLSSDATTISESVSESLSTTSSSVVSSTTLTSLLTKSPGLPDTSSPNISSRASIPSNESSLKSSEAAISTLTTSTESIAVVSSAQLQGSSTSILSGSHLRRTLALAPPTPVTTSSATLTSEETTFSESLTESLPTTFSTTPSTTVLSLLSKSPNSPSATLTPTNISLVSSDTLPQAILATSPELPLTTSSLSEDATVTESITESLPITSAKATSTTVLSLLSKPLTSPEISASTTLAQAETETSTISIEISNTSPQTNLTVSTESPLTKDSPALSSIETTLSDITESLSLDETTLPDTTESLSTTTSGVPTTIYPTELLNSSLPLPQSSSPLSLSISTGSASSSILVPVSVISKPPTITAAISEKLSSEKQLQPTNAVETVTLSPVSVSTDETSTKVSVASLLPLKLTSIIESSASAAIPSGRSLSPFTRVILTKASKTESSQPESTKTSPKTVKLLTIPVLVQESPILIISESGVFNSDNSFNYSYETDNGIRQEESGYQKPDPSNNDKDATVQVMAGSYSYTAPDGTLVISRYTADENGFHPVVIRRRTNPVVSRESQSSLDT